MPIVVVARSSGGVSTKGSKKPVKTRGSAAVVEKHRVALGERQEQLSRDVPFAGEEVRNLVFDD